MTKGGQSSQSLPDDDLRNALRPWWEAGATFEMLRLHTTDGYIAACCVFDKKGRKQKNGARCTAPDQTQLFYGKPKFLAKKSGSTGVTS